MIFAILLATAFVSFLTFSLLLLSTPLRMSHLASTGWRFRVVLLLTAPWLLLFSLVEREFLEVLGLLGRTLWNGRDEN